MFLRLKSGLEGKLRPKFGLQILVKKTPDKRKQDVVLKGIYLS